jgi:hypothetical protein
MSTMPPSTALAATCYKTYQERCKDPRNDPFAGNYKSIMKLFTTKPSIKRTPSTGCGNCFQPSVRNGRGSASRVSTLIRPGWGPVNHHAPPAHHPNPSNGEPRNDEFVILLGDQWGKSPPITVYPLSYPYPMPDNILRDTVENKID